MFGDSKSQSRNVNTTITLADDVEIATLEFGKFLVEVDQSEIVILCNLYGRIFPNLASRAQAQQKN